MGRGRVVRLGDGGRDRGETVGMSVLGVGGIKAACFLGRG